MKIFFHKFRRNFPIFSHFSHFPSFQNLKKFQFQVKHEFKNYGRGLRKIEFTHSGRDRRYWAGHYGSKMARACVKVKVSN